MSISHASPVESRRLNVQGLKRCGRCQTIKPHDEFGVSRNRWDGMQGYCKDCRSPGGPPPAPRAPRTMRPAAPRPPAPSREDLLALQAVSREALRSHWATNDPRTVTVPKRCPRCQQHRPRADYSTNPSNRDGLATVCRPCDADRRSERRARLRDAWVEHVEREVLWGRDEGICYLCGLPADPDRWDVDHIAPICHGGEHSYANTAVTHPSCNRSKNGTPWPDVHFDPLI